MFCRLHLEHRHFHYIASITHVFGSVDISRQVFQMFRRGGGSHDTFFNLTLTFTFICWFLYQYRRLLLLPTQLFLLLLLFLSPLLPLVHELLQPMWSSSSLNSSEGKNGSVHSVCVRRFAWDEGFRTWGFIYFLISYYNIL